MARKNEKGGFKQALVEFPEAEKRFLKHHEVCRVATSHNDTPHVTPVNFVFDDGFFYFATDYDTKKYRNLAKNKKSALVVDVYNSSKDNKAVIVQGVVEFVERGEEFQKLYDIFYEKFDWVREDPWKEGEAPFVKVKPLHKPVDSWETIAKASELPSRSMKHVEIKGKEIALINLDGKYYAMNDRCGHMNAALSKGEIRNVQGKDIVTCPLHFSTFDIVTGKKLSEPMMSPPMDMAALPKPLQDAFAHAAQIMAFVKTYDMETFQVERDGDDIKLKINS